MNRKIIAVVAATLVMLTGCSVVPERKSNTTFQGNTVADSGDIDNTEILSKDEGDNKPSEVSQKVSFMNITLYYQDTDRYLIPVTRNIVKQEAIARATINGLVDSSLNTEETEYYGLYPVLPEGTQVRGLSIKNGIAVIDFTSNFLQYKDARDERNIIACVVYSLTEFSTVKKVKILVEGKIYSKLKFGSDISGELSRKNVLINANKLNCSTEKSKFDVYYNKSLKENVFCLLPVSFETTEDDSELYTADIIVKLSQKPEDEKLFTELMQGTNVNDIKILEGVLTIDLNEQFIKYGGGTMREGLILDQIAYSMRQIDGVTKVKLLIEGKERELPEGSMITNGILLKSVINKGLLGDWIVRKPTDEEVHSSY